MEYSQETINKLQKLKKDFFAGLPDRLSNLQTQWQVFLEESDLEALKTVILTIHTLSGTSGTFGYDELCDRAKALEGKLHSIEPFYPQHVETYAAITSEIEALREYALTMSEVTQFLEKPSRGKDKGSD